SLYNRLREGAVLILDDGSLRPYERTLLAEHVPGVKIERLAAIDMGRCPRGGCWERLAWIMELSQNSYVIQLDSDTITCGDIDEVVDCYRANRSFTLGTRQGRRFVTLTETHDLIKDVTNQHVQILAERAMYRLPNAELKRYVRGGAAFAGFGRHSCQRQDLEAFAVEMERLVGERWRTWGSEQVASNFMIANSAWACVLPFPKYSSFHGGDHAASVFLHFIGSSRFDKGVYVSQARRAIQEVAHPAVFTQGWWA